MEEMRMHTKFYSEILTEYASWEINGRWENNIKMGLKDSGCESGYLMHVVQDGV
jgi:hypothetical protein